MAQSTKVLLVDRHNLTREGLLKILATETDFELVGATSDEHEVVDLAAALRPNVLVLDGTLPGAASLIQQLVEREPAVKILVLALDCDVPQAVNLLSLGATSYICKHTTPKDFFNAIRHTNRGETILSPKTARGVVDQLMHTGPGPAGDELHDLLTEREVEVLELLCQGLTDKDIGQRLHISPRTVNGHLGHIYSKFNVHSRTEMMVLALEKGWVNWE
ncbi:MAG TPA: response regulator transcription factor [Anaerolineae bacterium]|nr:response regulator transcription factor [Anaerolineae bacterium]